ncbi:MAG TPA: DUF1571 domain-containing protein, partial [Gemmatales bacterium]|nr:DUF1571 domain-containing protein [Gemmatales bacterium]
MLQIWKCFIFSALFIICHSATIAQSNNINPARAAKLRTIISNAQQSLERLDNYRVRLRRREVVPGKQRHEDIVMLTIRAKPFTIHVKCLPGSSHEGREIIYNASQAESLEILTGKADVLSGLRMNVAMDSEMVTANCRRGLNEAGFVNVMQRFVDGVDRYLAGQPHVSVFETMGLQTRTESRAPMEVVLQRIPDNEEFQLPHGGTRYWHFSTDADLAERHLPTLIITFDDKGQEVEYYHHDRLLPRVTMEPHDFEPDR